MENNKMLTITIIIILIFFFITTIIFGLAYLRAKQLNTAYKSLAIEQCSGINKAIDLINVYADELNKIPGKNYSRITPINCSVLE